MQEFQTALETKSASDLRHALKLKRRVKEDETTPESEQAIRLISLLTAIPKFSDWKALVPGSLQAFVEPKISTKLSYSTDVALPPEGTSLL